MNAIAAAGETVATAVGPIAVIGAGTMGSGIAQAFAAAGRRVFLMDQDDASLKRGLSAIEKSLDRMMKKGAIDAKGREETLGRIRGAGGTSEFAECAIAVEAVPERLDLKKTIFRELDRVLPEDAILATNTSSISITELAAATRRAARVVGMHFMNPVPLMQLVEIVRGHETSERTVNETVELSKALGKVPVVVEDRPGFVSNRVPDADDQRSGVLPDGRRQHARGHRHGHEAGHEPSDRAAGAGGPDRSRVCLDIMESCTADSATQIPPVPASSDDGRGEAGSQVGRLLRLSGA
jgi:predicted dinucleotide-binding enzyme